MNKSNKGMFTVLALSAALAACGGGGGGGGGASTTTSDPSSTTPIVVSPPSSGQRQVSADCSFTQKIGAARNDNLRISRVSWLQSVQLDSNDIESRLAGAKAVKMRIDVLANNSPLAPVIRSVKVYNAATSGCVSIPVNAPSRVPSSVNEHSLTTAFTADIPAELVQPGMSVSLWLDDNVGRSESEADATYRVLQPRVAPAITETIRIIPIRLSGITGGVSSAEDIASLIERMYPVSQVNVVYAPVLDVGGLLSSVLNLVGSLLYGSIGQMQNLLDTLDDRCAELNGSQWSARTAPKCIGVLPSNLIFSADGGAGQVVGLAYVGGTTMLARSVTAVDNFSVSSPYQSSHWINFNAMTLAHEFGHVMDLDHAACGGATGLDPRLYNDGGLAGGAGYDAVRGSYFSSIGTTEFADVMSYCGKEWMSDRGYLAAMAYRAGSANIAARSINEPSQWLKISLGASGWKVRRSSFAPNTLVPSTLTLRVSSEKGQEALALSSAVVSEHHETGNYGPFFINLGDRDVSALSLESSNVQLASWSADVL
jgi:hypothetical protein